MATSGTNIVRMRIALFGTASTAIAVALAMPAAAFAQDKDAPAEASDIVVTGTRIVRDGYKAPTPTSVIGVEELAAKAPVNIADFVNLVPSLAGATTPRSTGSYVSSGLAGINALNLRNLGPNRTLVLLDGQRVGGSSLTGIVDINQLPQGLVKRVDIVTGGVSADYGSDAVAGVVNFVLDKEFTGVKGTVQGGVTTYGDDRNYNISLTAGTKFADDRGHIVLSGEIAHQDGIAGIGKRKWYRGSKIIFNPAYNATTNNTVPQLLVRDNVGFQTATPGGIITSALVGTTATTALNGTYFGPDGVPAQFNYGSLSSGNFTVGGDWAYADYATSQDLDPETNRQNIFGRISYDVTDDINIYAQGSYNRNKTSSYATDQFNLGNITIRSDNAFIPAPVAARVAALGVTTFTLGTLNRDLRQDPEFGLVRNNRSSWRAVVGAEGAFDMLDTKWTWNVSGQRSRNNVYLSYNATVTSRFNAAIDAVRNPATGAIICRSTLTNPTNGCAPYNIFGTGVASQAAVDYVTGTSWGKTKLTQDVFGATLHGDPFSTWAGPVSIATGYEHRREAASGTNDPLTTPTATTRAYFSGNFLASAGSYNIDEAFLETVVPLAKDSPLAERLDLLGAVRFTNYSTSGSVVTWKAGITYSPVSDVTFRFTRSRDIRAPNLAELFQTGLASNTTVADPFRNNASTTFISTTKGNLNLKPEKADTLGIGVVVQPSFLPGFAASADFYDIRIRDAIQTVSAATLVQQCSAGNTALCSQITRATSGTQINGLFPISNVTVFPTNLAKQIARGLDFEASYRRPLFGGGITIRGLATRYLKNYSNNGINKPIDTVGTNGANTTVAAANGSGSTSLPKWRYLASISFDRDPVSLTLIGRGFSAGVYQTSNIECTTGCPVSTPDNMTIDSNRLPGALYFDANVTVKLPSDIEAFLAVDNIANKNPAQVAYGPNLGGAPLPVNSSLYDVLGRTFRVGVRFKM